MVLLCITHYRYYFKSWGTGGSAELSHIETTFDMLNPDNEQESGGITSTLTMVIFTLMHLLMWSQLPFLLERHLFRSNSPNGSLR